jgi:hypothetical protein
MLHSKDTFGKVFLHDVDKEVIIDYLPTNPSSRGINVAPSFYIMVNLFFIESIHCK